MNLCLLALLAFAAPASSGSPDFPDPQTGNGEVEGSTSTSSTIAPTTIASTTSSTTPEIVCLTCEVPHSEVAVSMTFVVEATVEKLNTIGAGDDKEFNSAFKKSVDAALDSGLQKVVTINKIAVVETVTGGRRLNGKSVQVDYTVKVRQDAAESVETALRKPSTFNASFARSMTERGHAVKADSITTTVSASSTTPTASSTTVPAGDDAREVKVSMTFDVEVTGEELNTFAAGIAESSSIVEFNSAFKTSVAAALGGVLETDVTINEIVVETATGGQRLNLKSVRADYTVKACPDDVEAVETALRNTSAFNASFAESMTDRGQAVKADSITTAVAGTTANSNAAPTTATAASSTTKTCTMLTRTTTKAYDNSAALSAVAAIVVAVVVAAFGLH